ncbi:putative peptide zinc metalloprotease protein [Sinomonas sp. RB5]
MTVPPGRAPAAPASSAPRIGGPVPARADGVELIGELKGSGYRDAPALVRRADGQTLQLTPLLYSVLSAVDGRSSVSEIADRVSRGSGRRVTAENVRTLMDSKLLPLGLLARADGSQPEVRRSNPLLSLRFRYTVTDKEKTRRLTGPFAALFRPWIVVPLVAAFLFVSWWVLAEKGLASATYQAFDSPGLLLLVVAVTVFSAGFHEFGHAAGARYGGATPGAMGAGLYLFWPAFYTDVTDSYRLGRAGRVRTDLGGLYFNAIVTVLIAGIWWATQYDALLLVVLTQILQMIRQLTPLVRFDGYHVLADVTGVPDLYHRIRPTLLGLLPWRWGHPETKALKPWARAVVTLWVLIVVPVLLGSLALMVITLPRVLATAWASTVRREGSLAAALGTGDLLAAGAQAVMILAAALPVLGMGLILFRMLTRGARSVWQKTRGRPGRRASAVIAGVALVAVLATLWWPNGSTYRPIRPYERGTVADVLAARAPVTDRLVQGQEGRVAAIWPQGVAKPTADKPQLGMVLVPRTGQAPAPGNASGPAPAPAPAWVFPFSKPSPPGDGGNQALAVNTKDGSVVYDVAFAMVWVQDGSALNVNEADAFASCRDCAAVAVAFQVVLLVGQVHAVVPQNLAVAANYNCTQCLAYAVANQLVLTLDQPLSPAGLAQLSTLWNDINAFQATIQDQPLTQIQARLNQYAAQIRQIIQQDPSTTHQAPSSAPATTEPAGPSGAPASSAPTPGASVPDTVTTPSAPGAGAPAAPASEAPAQTAAPGSTDAPPSPAPAETAMPVPTASPS